MKTTFPRYQVTALPSLPNHVLIQIADDCYKAIRVDRFVAYVVAAIRKENAR